MKAKNGSKAGQGGTGSSLYLFLTALPLLSHPWSHSEGLDSITREKAPHMSPWANRYRGCVNSPEVFLWPPAVQSPAVPEGPPSSAAAASAPFPPCCSFPPGSAPPACPLCSASPQLLFDRYMLSPARFLAAWIFPAHEAEEACVALCGGWSCHCQTL